MCGIVGKLYFDRMRMVDQPLIRSMADTIRHRGPDDRGEFVQGPVGFGFRRLSIIDLTPAGHQPMSNEDGTVWIIFNGEIYNFQELRPDLERRGHVFRSQTDTEVVLHSYEEYGVECLQRLRGMFAFAIWDARQRRLLLARDRLGKKPLKYCLNERGISFASELKALLRDPDTPVEVDLEAVHHYLTFQYVPHPRTGFSGIQKLPPAHYLTVDCATATPRVGLHQYWSVDAGRKLRLTEAEWMERILAELEESVRMRMIADVPLGAFLSGGVDSSAVVAMMAKNSPRPVKTFSIGFADERYNELPYARMVARQYATDHQEFIVEPDAVSVLPQLVEHYEEPYADSSALPTYYLSKMTRQHVTVALNGDGGDENFAGYPWYPILRFAARYRRLPVVLRKAAAVVPAALADLFRHPTMRYVSVLSRASSGSLAAMHTELMAYFSAREKGWLEQPWLRERARPWRSAEFLERYYRQAGAGDSLDQALYVDQRTYLPDDLLVKVDIASMAVSLEARSPFLDHRFIELTSSMPSDLKLRGREGKHIVKKALLQLLPKDLLYRPKRGFMVPIETWFRGSLRQYAREVLLDQRAWIRELLVPAAIERLLGEHDRGARHGRRIWALLTLELWHQRFFGHPVGRTS